MLRLRGNSLLMRLPLRAPLGLVAAAILALPACGGGGGGGSSSPNVPAPNSSTPTTQSAYSCPSSDGTSSVLTGSSASETTIGRAPARTSAGSVSAATSGRIAVTYERSAYAAASARFEANEARVGGSLVRTFDYSSLGRVVRVLAVPPSQVQTAVASLRAQSGVLSAAPTQRRFGVTAQANLVSNHYFQGFTPDNSPPYYEGTGVPGQWDMHAILLEY